MRVLGRGGVALLLACGSLWAAEGVAPVGKGDGRWFEDVTARAGLAHKHNNRRFENPYAEIMAGYTALGAAAAVADYDGDGFEDLFVTDSSAAGRITSTTTMAT